MHKRKHFDPTEPPSRWLNCPRKANALLVDKFLAFKVPLNSKFDNNVSIEYRWNLTMLFDAVRRNNLGKIGLIIDLTNTDRFYDSENEVKKFGIRYYKLSCRG
jgi:mRNA-capping enzyme